MSLRARVCCSLAASLLLSGAFAAAATGKSLGRLKDIRVTGLKTYTPEEVLAVASLAAGQDVTEDDLKEATNQLGRTGAFSNLSYSYSTQAGAARLTLELEETDKVLAVRLDNFVWWAEDDLRTKLKARVPLYRDQLPIAGTLADSVADGLQAILSERQLPGHVTYTRFGPEGHPLEAFVFHVEDIVVRVRSVDFPGAGADELPALQSAARNQLVGKPYSAAQISLVAGIDFRDVYQRRGYLQAEFGAPTPTAPDAPPPKTDASEFSDDANIVHVDVRLPVKPGLQFRMAALEWTGNHTIPTEALQKFVAVQPGEIADLPRLREGLQQVNKLYGTRGYMRVQQKVEPRLDTTAKTAAFAIQIVEGDVYRFGDLTIEGVDSKTAARLREHWTLREGEPFNTSYEMDFLKETQALLPQGRWSAAEAHLDESDKTVDVVLRYAPSAIN